MRFPHPDEECGIIRSTADKRSLPMEKRDTLLMKIAPLAGRILIASIFVKAGLSKMIGPEQAQQYMAAYGMSMTRCYLIVTIIVELGGGLALAAGYYTRIVAGALFLFLI